MKTIVARSLTIVIPVLVINLVSCDGDNPVGGRYIPPAEIPVPTPTGALWTYEVYDSLTSTTDTVLVSVVDTVTLGNGIHTSVWKCKRDAEISMRFVGKTGDTLAIFYDSLDLQQVEYFLFPLTIGAVWSNGHVWGADTSRVVDSGQIVVPAGDFDGAVRVDRVWGRDFEGGGSYRTTWIVPGVGFAYFYRLSMMSDGSTLDTIINEEWNLLGYDLSTFHIAQFPALIDAEWSYETYDSVAGVCDTMLARIVGAVTFPDGTDALVWVHDFEEWADTQYIVVTGDRIDILPDTVFSFIYDWYFEFPLVIGRYWGMILFTTVPEIIEKGPVSVPAGTFESGFHYVYFGGAFNDYWYIDAWLVPDVGIVSLMRKEFGFGPGQSWTWKLLGYQIDR